MRNIEMQTGFLRAPSCLISCGNTRVLCAATVSEGVPPFLKGKGQGWLTAEYAMLPASTGGGRKPRDGVKKDGRGVEISRLIGRSLRQAVDMTKLGERTITIDCDVIEADGGTRCASITGGFVALCLAVDRLIAERKLFDSPIVRQVAAVSCGVVAGENALDLCYEQDSRADVDMNVIMDENRNLIEIQGTGEHAVFPRARLSQLLDLAEEGIDALMQAQREALGEAARWIAPKTPRLLFATNNAHKARELKDIMTGKYEVLSLREAGVELDVDETGETFAENALLKAEAVTKLTGCAALADDTGLCVDALGGAPGVRSARYAGEHGNDGANVDLLLENLKDTPAPRTARFVCAMALTRPGREPLVVEGRAEGEILFERRGENGFGYDPVFLYGGKKTFAEMDEHEKNAVSHRRNAARALLAALEAE